MSSTALNFSTLSLSGHDTEKFLQGQLTLDVSRLVLNQPKPAAICDLKGRVAFGLWVVKLDETNFQLFFSQDFAESLPAHIKKYAAFSKISCTDVQTVFPVMVDQQPCFNLQQPLDDDQMQLNLRQWQQCAIAQGDYWITTATAGLFQPQELRLHQRGGVDYDKGCYLGQEIVARLWFRAAPKAWLHRVAGSGKIPAAGELLADGHVNIVNCIQTAIGWEGLAIAKPTDLLNSGLQILPLPEVLNGDVARQAT